MAGGTVGVLWDHGNRNQYRNGAEGARDLSIYDNVATGWWSTQSAENYKFLVNRFYLPTTKGFMMQITFKLFYLYFSIFLNFHLLQVISTTTSRELRKQFATCGGWDYSGKYRLERVNRQVIKFNFSPTWSRVSLMRFTTKNNSDLTTWRSNILKY